MKKITNPFFFIKKTMSNDEIKKENNFKKKRCEPVLTF